MIIVFPKILGKNVNALTIFPLIILKNPEFKNDIVLINHEKIHLKQQLELLWIVFFLWYIIEYAIRKFQYNNADMAYRNISFEREAYANENNLQYIKKRKMFGFLRYL